MLKINADNNNNNDDDSTRKFLKWYRKTLSVRLTRSQPGRHRFSKPKNGTEFWWQKLKENVLGEIQVVSAVRFRLTNNPQPWKDNSASGGGKEKHNRVGQSREVGTGAPQPSPPPKCDARWTFEKRASAEPTRWSCCKGRDGVSPERRRGPR
jgi:hypothetical protein